MRKKSIIVTVLLVVTAMLTTSCGVVNDSVTYKTAKVTRGNIETTVTSSGKMQPLISVDVGTQVSGTITSVYVDYNDKVEKGQLLAVLDTFLLKLSVNDASANLEKSSASLELAKSEFIRKEAMYKDSLISEADFIPYKTAYRSSLAGYKSANIAYIKAKRNVDYAYIKSPIDGVIIDKKVEEGQTVASSLSAPTLFSVAQDLRDIQILVSVDEGDIGSIKKGMDVNFSVQAYPDKIYRGVVDQIRLQALEESNVVNYVVVVLAKNEDLTLLPGMTTMVDFIVNVTENVLIVPSAALKFFPSDDIQNSVMATKDDERKVRAEQRDGASIKEGYVQSEIRDSFAKKDSTDSQDSGMRKKRKDRSNMKFLWYEKEGGELDAISVKIGDSNGSFTEVTSRNPNLKEGLNIIIKSNAGSNSASKASLNANNHRPMRF